MLLVFATFAQSIVSMVETIVLIFLEKRFEKKLENFDRSAGRASFKTGTRNAKVADAEKNQEDEEKSQDDKEFHLELINRNGITAVFWIDRVFLVLNMVYTAGLFLYCITDFTVM